MIQACIVLIVLFLPHTEQGRNCAPHNEQGRLVSDAPEKEGNPFTK